jgi:hypothetical protein
MSEPVYFVIERFGGKRSAALVHGVLPTKYQGRHARANGLHYQQRVDDKPHLAGRSPAELYEIWELLGELPAKP